MVKKLDKFLNFSGGLGGNLAAIREAVFKVTGHNLGPNQFKVNGQTVWFSACPPPLHTEIIIKKKEILAELERLLGQAAPKKLI